MTMAAGSHLGSQLGYLCADDGPATAMITGRRQCSHAVLMSVLTSAENEGEPAFLARQASRPASVSLGQRQKRKRVRPPGSVAKTTVAERGSMRYTFHGGDPCDGALNGAVMPDPL
jgi:hypothetical protein